MSSWKSEKDGTMFSLRPPSRVADLGVWGRTSSHGQEAEE